jgi:holo-[acyl-carrier protein] synthase
MELTGLAHVIGVGTDLVDVDRVRAALERQEGLRQRLFTEAEWEYSARHRDPMPHLAGRFAAKEAVMKALGHGMDRVSFHEIEVLREDSGRPSVRLTGRAAEVAGAAGVAGWHLSLSHTATLAQAVAVAVGADPGGA